MPSAFRAAIDEGYYRALLDGVESWLKARDREGLREFREELNKARGRASKAAVLASWANREGVLVV